MASLALGTRFNATSAGTGSFVDASAVTGYARAVGRLVDGKSYRYRAENSSLSEWEWGTGVWNASAGSLTRVITLSSAGAVVAFTAAPQVAITLEPSDVLQTDNNLSEFAAAPNPVSANLGILNTAQVQNGAYSILAADRGKTLQCALGRGNNTFWTLPNANVGAGWFVGVENTGYGQLVVQTTAGQVIDGALPSVQAHKGQPMFWMVSTGAGWRAVGRQLQFVIARTSGGTGLTGIDFELPDVLEQFDVKLVGVYAGASGGIIMRSSNDGGASYGSSSAEWKRGNVLQTTAAPTSQATDGGGFQLSPLIQTFSAIGNWNLDLNLWRRGGTNGFLHGIYRSGGFDTTTSQYSSMTGGAYNQVAGANFIRFLTQNGSISYEQAVLIGYAS